MPDQVQITTDDFTNQIARQYLAAAAKVLKNGKMTAQQGKESAQYFLTLTPFKDIDDAKEKVHNFTESFKPLIDLRIWFLKYEEEHRTKEVLKRMSNFIHSNDIDSAVKLVK